MKIKTSEMIGPALDWAVAACEGYKRTLVERGFLYTTTLILKSGRPVKQEPTEATQAVSA